MIHTYVASRGSMHTPEREIVTNDQRIKSLPYAVKHIPVG